MKLSQAIHQRKWILVAFFFLLDSFQCSSCAQSQQRAFPHITSNVEEIVGKLFDYIIVGGGTAGCPLAATLSEKYSVLVVERGGSPYENPKLMDKKLFGEATLEADEFLSPVQRFISEDGVPSFRGRVLGGSSVINGGFYSRASNGFVKRAGWDEEAVKKAYEWVESMVVFEPNVTDWQRTFKQSLVESGIRPFNGYSLEHIEGTKVGATIIDRAGKRHSSAELLRAGNLENITILLNTTVRKVVFRTKHGDRATKRAYGIKLIKSDGTSRTTHKVYLNPNTSGDVILSAGALGSPQLLMLSGIGSFNDLKNYNISLIADRKEVGHGMKDNPAIAFFADSDHLEKRQPDTPQVVGIADHSRVIIETGIFPLTHNISVVSVAAKLAFVKSRGTLMLNGLDSRKNPNVWFNYLSEEEDIEGCVRLVKLLRRIERARPIASFWGTAAKSTTNKKSGDELMDAPENKIKRLCKSNLRTFYHYHGGCLVGSVVDNDYRVLGVKGLRVIDGSTLSESPGTNPMATILMLGRYQGVKIVKESSDSNSNST